MYEVPGSGAHSKPASGPSSRPSRTNAVWLIPRPDIVDLLLVWGAAVALLVVAAPAALVAAAVWAALAVLKPHRAAALVFLGVTLFSLAAWGLLRPAGAVAALDGYLDAQTLGIRNIEAALNSGAADWPAYGLALVPYALAVGAPLGLFAYTLPLLRVWAAKYLHLGDYTPMARWREYGATELRRAAARVKIDEYVTGFCAKGRMTVITALPKKGKSKALAGLFRAFQEGWAWFGRFVRKGLSIYVATEEDQLTFAGKLNEFGITSATVTSTHLPELEGWLGPDKWETLTTQVYQNAQHRKRDIVVWDTLTSWAPWAQRGNEHMSFCLSVLKRKTQKYGMATIVVLHNRKSGGGEEGAVVGMIGSIAGAAAYDAICDFERDKPTGVCTLEVVGRWFDEWEANARLDGVQYAPIPEEDKGEDDEVPAKGKPLSVGLVQSLTALKAAGRPLTQAEVVKIVGKDQSQVSRDLNKLVTMDLAVLEGKGTQADPKRYRVPLEGEVVNNAPPAAAGAAPAGPTGPGRAARPRAGVRRA